MTEKIYCGSGKEKFDGDLIAVSVCLSDYPDEYINEYNGKKYLRLNVQRKREIDQYGKSHSVSVDTWKPEEKTEDIPF